MTKDINALIGSRICHDLISPIGAIGNGLELLEMTIGAKGPEMSLIEDSVTNANARIRFFRVAFGDAKPSQMVGKSEVLSILADLANGGRFSYVWHPTHDVPRTDVRLAFLAIQCFETSLPLGGVIEVTEDQGNWTMVAQGRRVVVEPRLWDGIASGGEVDQGLKPSEVQFALLPTIANRCERQMAWHADEEQITVTF